MNDPDTKSKNKILKKTLVYGYGNPGRQDDALGVLIAERIGNWAKEKSITQVETDSNYQLNIEDAAKISEYDVVIFCDASIEEIEDFSFTRVTANDSSIEFTMHATSPAFIFDLCEKIFHKTPEAYLLHLKGYEWEFMEGLTERAAANLDKAEICLKEKIISNIL